MPYCVNCGVELNQEAEACPLCATVVVSPSRQTQGKPERAKSAIPADDIGTFDKGLWIKLVSIILAVPVLLSLVIDGVLMGGISWSLYVAASLLLVWVWMTSPFYCKSNCYGIWITVDALVLLAYLFAIERISHTVGWFLPLAVPVTISLYISVLLSTWLTRKNLIRELQIPSLAIFLLGILSVIINGSISLYNFGKIKIGWSLLVFIPALAIGAIGVMLQRRRWIVEELKHWFRV